MIFEFLDAKRRRIETYTDSSLVYGIVRRELVGRIIKDSIEAEFTLDLLQIVEDSTYLLLGDTEMFRVNPMYKIADLTITSRNTVSFTGTSQTLANEDEVKLKWEGVTESRTEELKEQETIPYETEYVDNIKIPEGESKVIQEGVDGTVEKTYLITYIDGEEKGRVLTNEEVIQEPINKVVENGTGVTTYEEVVVETVLPYTDLETQYIEDPTMLEGETEMFFEGQDGLRTDIYKVEYFNGEEVNRKRTGGDVVSPEPEIYYIGTGVLRTEEVWEYEELDYEVERIPTTNLSIGEERVIQEGQTGYRNIAYEITYIGSKEISRKKIDEIIQEPENMVVEYGTFDEENQEYIYEYTEHENIDYHEVIYKERPDKPIWYEERIQEGRDGIVKVRAKYTFGERGDYIGYEEEEEVIEERQDEIWEYGTDMTTYVEYEFIKEDFIDYETEYIESEEFPIGFEYKLQEGVEGSTDREYEIRYKDGEEVERIPTGNGEFEYYPENEVIIKGTRDYGYETEVKVGNIPYETERIADVDGNYGMFFVGEEFNIGYGEDGVIGRVYKVESGTEIKELVNEVELVEPKNNIVIYGTVTERNDYHYELVTDEYQTIYIDDPNLPEGEWRYGEDSEGQDGLYELEWNIKEEYIDGVWVEVDRFILYEYVIDERVDVIIYVGTGEENGNTNPINVTSMGISSHGNFRPTRAVMSREVNYNSTGLMAFINEECAKVGLELEVLTFMSELEMTVKIFRLLDEEFTLEELIEALLQVLDGVAEFDTVIEEDYVAKTKLRIGDDLGSVYDNAIEYGLNVTDYKIDKRRDNIITAIEYTGMEIDDETGELLTLKGIGGIDKRFSLPKTMREATITTYVDTGGNTRYLLEDTNATEQFGHYKNHRDARPDPIIETHRNKRITTKEDLLSEAVKELDGKNIPRTQYRINASLTGLDVKDTVGIKLEHINIDQKMPVIAVEYDLGNNEEVYVTVGDYIPTEIDRVFEELPSKTGGRGGGSNKVIRDNKGKEYNWNEGSYDYKGNPYIPSYWDSDGNWQQGGYIDSFGDFNPGFFDNNGDFHEDLVQAVASSVSISGLVQNNWGEFRNRSFFNRPGNEEGIPDWVEEGRDWLVINDTEGKQITRYTPNSVTLHAWYVESAINPNHKLFVETYTDGKAEYGEKDEYEGGEFGDGFGGGESDGGGASGEW